MLLALRFDFGSEDSSDLSRLDMSGTDEGTEDGGSMDRGKVVWGAGEGHSADGSVAARRSVVAENADEGAFIS